MQLTTNEEKYFFASFVARNKTYLTLLKLWKDSTGKSSRPNRNSFSSHKLVLLGGQSVGKTSLTLRFVDGKFTSGQTSTIVAAFLSKTIQLEDETIKLEIWDTAGQERFNSLVPMYYRGAGAAIIVYDITSSKSFQRAKSWIGELHRQANPDIVIALAGNKSDDASNRLVTYDEAFILAEKNNLIFFETSAKDGHNVDELFMAISKKMSQNNIVNAPNVIQLEEEHEEKKSVNSCNR